MSVTTTKQSEHGYQATLPPTWQRAVGGAATATAERALHIWYRGEISESDAAHERAHHAAAARAHMLEVIHAAHAAAAQLQVAVDEAGADPACTTSALAAASTEIQELCLLISAGAQELRRAQAASERSQRG